MKRLIHIAGILALIAAPALAEDTPRAGPADQRVKFVEYQETEVYRIVGTFRTATQVVLGADETIEHVALGDTVYSPPNLLVRYPKDTFRSGSANVALLPP